nr:hypothetical protein [Tanacetum cinerariifolium]
FLHHSSANSWQWDLHSSGSRNTLHWQWELILPVGTLFWQWECLVYFIPNIKCKKQTVVATSTTEAEYVAAASYSRQTATVRTVNNREQEITSTVDGKEFTITEASVRRHLQLAMQIVLVFCQLLKFLINSH